VNALEVPIQSPTMSPDPAGSEEPEATVNDYKNTLQFYRGRRAAQLRGG